MRTPLRPMRWIVAALAVTMAAACGAGSSAGEDEAPSKISIGVYSPGLEYAFVFVADGPEGKFSEITEKYGTEIELVRIPSGTNLVSSLAGGSTQFSIMPGVSTIASAQEGMDILPLMGAFAGPATFILGAKEYEATRGADLTEYDGDRWAFSRIGSVGHLVVQEVAASNGLDWKNQTELPLGSGADAEAALAAGKAEVLVTGGEPGIKAMQQDLGYLLLNTQADEGLAFAHNINSIVNTTNEFYERHPEFTEEVLAAMLDGYIRLRDSGSAEEALALLPESAQADVVDTWDTQWELSRTGLTRASTGFSTEEIDATIELGRAGEVIGDEVDRNLFDNTLITRAYERLGLEAPDFG